MTKKNDWAFDVPTRQSYVAILLIIYKYYRVILRQIWPFLLIFIFKGKSGRAEYYLYGIIGFAVVAMIFAIIAYFKFYFYLKGDELIIEKGVLRKSKVSIPLDRVQTINKEQNLIHRIFSVVKLKIDTAGSVKNEFELDALSEEKADALRDLLLSKKSDLIAVSSDDGDDISSTQAHLQERIPIMSLSILDLLKVGVSQNHIRSGGLILAFMFGIYQNLEQAGLEMDEYGNAVPELDWNMGLMAILFFATVFFIISFAVSLVRTTLTNYDLSFWRQGDGFKVNYGLFNRKEYAALDRKIQIMTWSDSLLKKVFGINDLVLKQASSIAVNAKKAIVIPGCSALHIDQVYQYYFGGIEVEDDNFEEVDIRYFYRRALFSIVLGGVIIATGIFIAKQLIWIVGIFLLIYWCLNVYLSHQKLRYYVSKDIIRLHGGSYGDKHSVIHTYKIQAITIKQTPYQNRVQLANLLIFTASGAITIPYIGLERAQEIRDFLLKTVEVSREEWM